MSLPRVIRAFEIAVIESMLCYLWFKLSIFERHFMCIQIYIFKRKLKVLIFLLQVGKIRSGSSPRYTCISFFISFLFSAETTCMGNKCFFSIILYTTLNKLYMTYSRVKNIILQLITLHAHTETNHRIIPQFKSPTKMIDLDIHK